VFSDSLYRWLASTLFPKGGVWPLIQLP